MERLITVMMILVVMVLDGGKLDFYINKAKVLSK